MTKIGVVLLTAMLLFVAVAPAAAHHGGFRRVFVGPFVAPLLFPFAIAATITAGVAAVVTAPFAHPSVVSAAPLPPPARSYWYYCPSAGGYYPYVTACPGGWLTVVPQTTPPRQ